MKQILTVFSILSIALAVEAKEPTASSFLKSPETSGLVLKSAGKISFGPGGLLLVSDPSSASVVAIDTGDVGPLKPLAEKVENVEQILGKALNSEKVIVMDMAVNQLSGKIYFSVNAQPGNKPHLVSMDSSGKVATLGLDELTYVRMTLPTGENEKLRNVTDLAWGKDSVIVAGQSSEEFANKIFQIPAPLEHGENAHFLSAETYHVAHRKWETKAPIQSFIPWEENGDLYIVGAFACTPIAKFPISDLESGTKIKGTSVVELGGGNRPRDMFVYEKDGEEWLVTNTLRFQKNLFGPSKYWAARVKLEYLDADEPDEINENAARRNVNASSGPDAKGMEVVEELFGAVFVSQLENEKVIVFREVDPSGDGTAHNVELVSLP